MIQVDEDILNKTMKIFAGYKKIKDQSANTIKPKNNLKTTSIVDINPYGKVKIHITMDAYNIIHKNMDSGKVNSCPVMCFLQEENKIKDEADFNKRLKKAQDDGKLYGVAHIDIAFNDMETLERLSDVKIDEYYYLLWIEASISFIKYMLNGKKLGLEYSTKLIKEKNSKER